MSTVRHRIVPVRFEFVYCCYYFKQSAVHCCILYSACYNITYYYRASTLYRLVYSSRYSTVPGTAQFSSICGPHCGNALLATHTHITSIIDPPIQCEWHRMTRTTGPDCAVMCNLINTHTHTPFPGSYNSMLSPGYRVRIFFGSRPRDVQSVNCSAVSPWW